MSLPENNDSRPKKSKRARDNDDTLSSETEREEGKEDRLSDLPDCVLIHLMTCMTTRDSIRTSVLSTRWKHLWKRVPSLILHSWHFRLRITPLRKFVPQVLSLRDGSVPLQTLDLGYNSLMPQQLLTMVVRYTVSHNIQCLKLRVSCYDTDFPPPIFSCQTLRSLDLAVDRGFLNSRSVMWRPHVPLSLNLTALTGLRLEGLEFYADENELVEPFSSCVNLKSLVIDSCVMSNQQILCISNATLVDLTIGASTLYEEEEAYKIMLSTPNLCSFASSGFISHRLVGINLSRLKEVNIDVDDDFEEYYCHLQPGLILISWLQVFANVRSLRVSSSTLKALSLVPDLLNTESTYLDNLTSLTVNVRPSSPVPNGVVDYLIRNSPIAKITITNC